MSEAIFVVEVLVVVSALAYAAGMRWISGWTHAVVASLLTALYASLFLGSLIVLAESRSHVGAACVGAWCVLVAVMAARQGAKDRRIDEKKVTSESLVIGDVLEACTEEERAVVFGVWTPDGTCLKTGILTEAQVRVLVDVMRNDQSLNALNQLVDGPNRITYEQAGAIAESIAAEKFMSLAAILSERIVKQKERP